MSQELIERRSELRRSISTLEWDKKLGQLNFSKESILEESKKQLEDIDIKLKNEQIL
jgi:hypothetical protein